MTNIEPLVSTKWLAGNLSAPDLKIIDGSWRLPGDGAAIDDYRRRHIAGAVFFDIDLIADRSSDLPHMLAPVEQFQQQAGRLGVSNEDRVIVYDDQGLFSAARVWWTFRAMGHQNIAVLDGGLPKWRAEGRGVTDVSPPPQTATYRASLRSSMMCNRAAVRNAIRAADKTIIDARPAERFYGRAPEPRAGLRSGHMPGAVNVPHSALLNDDKTLRAPDALKAVFEKAGYDFNKPVITTCGSGVTAAIIFLALEVLGHERQCLYDGSWADWGDSSNDARDIPVVAGN